MDAESGRELAARLGRRWAVIEVTSAVAGALVVSTFVRVLHGGGPILDPHTMILVGYLAVGLPLGWAWRRRRLGAMWQWLREGRDPTQTERDWALGAPLRELTVPALFWSGAALVFGFLHLSESFVEGAVEVVIAIALGGVTTCALISLQLERLLRPVTARALAASPPRSPISPGIRSRLITAWTLVSGLPLLGLVLLAVKALSPASLSTQALATAVLILAGVALGVGAAAAVLSARSLADPLAAMRRALGRVYAGDLDVRVPVDDGSEVGLLQAGFNEMAAGLRERERLRDLFGRHVGVEVARRALAEGVSLGGHVREVAALFVDLVGSTALAASRPPEEVVSQLNRFFAIVIDVVEAHGGWVNKFEGDAALCIFGAPVDQPDMAGEALAAGRLLHQRLEDELPELDAGIGISAGRAVAGNVGGERRLEYTVIGDPVNEAARLCELAKHEVSRVLASATTLARASAEEARHWQLDGETVLRGRRSATHLVLPTVESPEVHAC